MMQHEVEYVRLYAGSDGESRFEARRVALREASYSPPAPPLGVGELADATRLGFLRLPPGWVADWHPSPHRQWLFVLHGELQVQASDATLHRFVAGSTLLVEDTAGKGHRSCVIGPGAVLIAAVQC